MKILNPLKMNDWPIKVFLLVILILQFIVLILTISKKIFEIPLLTEFLSFIYLTFVPGLLLVRILRLHEINTIKVLFYSIGLSIATIMGIGFLMNIIYPILRIGHPISFYPVLITLSLLVFLLSFFCYLIDKNFSNPSYIGIKDILNPYFLFLCLIPFLTIIGTYIMNFFNQNILQIIVMFILSFLPLISLKWIPKKYYPLAIFISSLSLLFHTTLISSFIWGQDINVEYQLANLVLENGYWNFTTSNNVNAMLSINILAPFYTLVVGIDLKWIYKIVFPFIFSLVPLGLFYIFKDISNSKISLLACYYFISVNAFFTTLPASARQEIAEFFLVILILLILDKKMDNLKKSFLTIIFGFSIIVSHYGLSYLVLILLTLAFLISVIPRFKKYLQIDDEYIFNKNFLILLFVFTLAWFMYISSSSIFNLGVNIGVNIFDSITELTEVSTQASNIISGKIPFLQSFERYLYLISQLFIGIGIISLFSNKYNIIKNKNEYSLFSMAAFVILLAAIVVPGVSSTLNTDRIFHISLIILAPFFVIGILTLANFLKNKMIHMNSNILRNKNVFYLISGFLIIFMLFNTAFFYQILDQPKSGRFALDNTVDFPIVNEMEFTSIKWFGQNYNPQFSTYTDVNKAIFFNSITGKNIKINTINSRDIELGLIFRNSYLFLSTYDINNKYMSFNKVTKDKSIVSYYNTSTFEERKGNIYDNGGSKILFA